MTLTRPSDPGPPAPASWLDLTVEEPPGSATLVAAVAVGLATDLAIRSGVVGLGGVVAVVVATAALAAAGRACNPQALALAALAPAFGMWLGLRQSPWLLVLDVVATGGLLGLAASFWRGGSVLDADIPSAIVTAGRAALHGAAAPAFVARAVRNATGGFAGGGSGRGAAVVRGAALALPVVLVLGLLLASADAVFASLFRLPGSPSALIGHAVLVGLGTWAGSALLRLASAEPPAPVPAVPRRLGHLEASVVLGALVALYAVFALTQVVAVAGGADHVIETAGLSYADYARSGFFQLLAVATLTVATLLAVRSATPRHAGRGDRYLSVLGVIAVALTLVIVTVALRRLHLYEQAFGLTMLRLYSTVFAGWLAAVLVALGLSLAGLFAHRSWFLPAVVSTGLAVLLGLNVTNPEAVVARHNLAAAAIGVPFDGPYLSSLSDDAVPAMVAGLPDLPTPAREALRSALCTRQSDHEGGLWATNASRSAADAALATVCP